VLGLEPDASADDIERAFLLSLRPFAPHAFGHLAHASAAFHVLRDPDARRAYDRRMGFVVDAPEPNPTGRTLFAGFHGRSAGVPLPRSIGPDHVIRRPEPAASSAPGADRVAAFLAAAHRPPTAQPIAVRTVPADDGKAQQLPDDSAPPPSPTAEAVVQPAIPSPPAPVAPVADPAVEEFAFAPTTVERADWKRPAMIGSGLVLAAIAIGTWAGLDAQQAPSDRLPDSVVAPLPAPKPATVDGTTSIDATIAQPVAGATIVEQRQWPLAARSQRPPSMPPHVAQATPSIVEPPAATAATTSALALDDAPEPVADQPATVRAQAMPLSNPVIARTIDRIGYSCGRVASTSASGSGGVFTITCVSGHSFQAKPVNGRYRFRKL
jgi:hypothetical protein